MGYLYEIARQLQLLKTKGNLVISNSDVNEEMKEDDRRKSDQNMSGIDNRDLAGENS